MWALKIYHWHPHSTGALIRSSDRMVHDIEVDGRMISNNEFLIRSPRNGPHHMGIHSRYRSDNGYRAAANRNASAWVKFRKLGDEFFDGHGMSPPSIQTGFPLTRLNLISFRFRFPSPRWWKR
jgi:hypothetical protein